MQKYIGLDTLHRPTENDVTSYRYALFPDIQLMSLFKSVGRCPRTVQDLICSLIMHLTVTAENTEVFAMGGSVLRYDNFLNRREEENLQEFYQQKVEVCYINQIYT